jgi:hypothetical protein
VQTDGEADLVEDELAIGGRVRRSQRLCSSSDFDDIRPFDAGAFEELGETEVEAIIEAPNHCGIASVIAAWGLEMEHLLHSPSPR